MNYLTKRKKTNKNIIFYPKKAYKQCVPNVLALLRDLRSWLEMRMVILNDGYIIYTLTIIALLYMNEFLVIDYGL